MSNTEVGLQLNNYDAVVCVQGLGFVGAAMAVVIASAKRADGTPRYLVIGVDQDTPEGTARICALGEGIFPFPNSDSLLEDRLCEAARNGNLQTTSDQSVFQWASVTVVDIPLDVDVFSSVPEADLAPFKEAIETLGNHMPAGSLVVLETTVPPGTTVNVVAPILANCLQKRGLESDAIRLAHSYERVMPGPDYFNSIARYWRVFAGINSESAQACRTFLSSIIDVASFPLTELSNPTASETAKVLENTYRAVNIALMEEWGHFAEVIGVDLFEIVDAIRMRPSHSNMRQPGLGVGGYCLTKDPYFPQIAIDAFFPEAKSDFPLTTHAMEINRNMPLSAALRIKEMFRGDLRGRDILVMGASYRGDVGDTRFSPSEALVNLLLNAGAHVRVHDPLATTWATVAVPVESELPSADNFDAIVFATPHSAFRTLDLMTWLGGHQPFILDSNDVLTTHQREVLLRHAFSRFHSTGRGFR